MAGNGPRDEVGKRSEKEIGAAEWLFRDDPAGKTARPPGPASSDPEPAGGDTFDLADSPFAEPGTEDPPMPPVPTAERTTTRPRDSARPKTDRAGDAYPIDPEALVDVVWSRGAEWGPDLIIVGGWLLGLAVLLYFLMGFEFYRTAFLLLLVGGAGAIILSYPILITLERPVRITPEQAVKDYFAALSHHFPHYRRMWLLLARTGRIGSSFGSFEGFKSYWKEKIRTIKGSQAGEMTPLVFEVENYRGDKSAGKAHVEVKFTLKIYIRGRRQQGPIASIPGLVSLVRGPDKMWYLENGTLPHAHREDRPA